MKTHFKKHQFTQSILSLALIFSTLSTSAQVAPEIQWKKWKLPGFELIYDAKRQDVADLYASRLLGIPQILKEYFPNPPENTVFVIDDRTDSTNGYATAIPYDTIVVYPVLPGPHETISDFGDWAREIALHEYTHISSFENRRGGAQFLYSLFGNIITPNMLLPRWWLEGVAVDLETRTGNHGRLRSPLQDAAVRALAFSYKLENLSIGEINETGIHTWPQGARPYLYGSMMWSEMIRRHGKKLIGDLHHAYGGRFPFFIESPILDQNYGTYQIYLNDLIIQLNQKAKIQRNTLSQIPLSEGSPLILENILETFHPVVSPDGSKLLLLAKNTANRRSVRILTRKDLKESFNGLSEFGKIESDISETQKESGPKPGLLLAPSVLQNAGIEENIERQDGTPTGTIQRLSWFPDSQKFIYDKVDSLDRFQESSDLYIYDLKTKKTERLTEGARAREASVSQDGQKIVFVKLGPSETQLVTLNLSNKKEEIIYKPELQVRVSSPLFLDEQNIVFSQRKDGKEYLFKLNLTSKEVKILLPDFPDARFPQKTSTSLLFSSTKNGIPNIYSYDLKTQKVIPLTNTLTALTSMSWDEHNKSLLATELTGNGFSIKYFKPLFELMADSRRNVLNREPATTVDSDSLTTTTPLSELRSPSSTGTQKVDELPRVEPLFAKEYPIIDPQNASLDQVSKLKNQIEDYSAGSYLWPHYWIPNLGYSSSNSTIGGSFSGNDPLNKHAYSVSASYETGTKQLSDQFIYMNNQTRAQISLMGQDLKTSVPNTSIDFRDQLYKTQALWEMSPISTDLFWGIGYHWRSRDYDFPYPASNTENHGPSLILQYSDISQGGAQISPTSGQSLSLEIQHNIKNEALENESFNQIDLSLQKFWNKWLPLNHAVLTKFSGQFIDKNLEDIRLANTTMTLSASPFLNALSPYPIMRGYNSAQFLGKNFGISTLEYRFPIAYPYLSSGTTPFFIKKFHGALVADNISLEGYSYDKQNNTYVRVGTWENFTSAGVELKADLTIGYHFPVTMMLGLYKATRLKEDEQNTATLTLQF